MNIGQYRAKEGAMMMQGIYKITNIITGEEYVGQSVDIKKRWYEHKRKLNNATHSLKISFKKFGIDKFEFIVLELCEQESLNERETHWINKLKPVFNSFKGGGYTRREISHETLEKLSTKAKAQWNALSMEKKTEYLTKYLTGPKIGHLVSEETREKLRQANLGKTQSKYTIEKRKATFIAKKQNGYVQDNKGHKKKVICLNNGIVYDSAKDAARAINVDPSCITHVIKGRQKTVRGYKFQLLQSVETNGDECSHVG